VDLVRPMANQKSITLQVALTDALPPLLGDAARLRQVFWNLLANAIKFTPDKGVVTLTADVSDGLARVAVRDTGIGIEPKFRRLLFQPFAQMHEGNARVHGGLGLGLAIVREVVELHGGNVRAESAGAGQGATFTVHLPVIKQREDVTAGAVSLSVEEPAPVPELVLHGLRVLLAEDDDGTREPLVAMLANRGADVRGVSSAAEAMKVFLEFKPQVVVSDVGMPGEDGYSFVRRIRQLSDEEGGQTPALALTAFARADDRRKAIDAGFDVHAAKPIEFERLASTLLELSRVGAERSEKQLWSGR
jgi:CheY-like chemotaxis protein